MRTYQSWGRYPVACHTVHPVNWGCEPLPCAGDAPLLAYGLGRSYGDVCLNDGGIVLDVRPLRRFIAFDRTRGTLRCEAGVSLADILALIVPAGWFLPVTPGTQFVTLGGAIANDVHGKNHHADGTFGRHVSAFELLRSDGSRRLCTPQQHADWYRATIGGLGLTGLITWAEIRLIPIHNPLIAAETVKFYSLDEFFELSAASEKDYRYVVAWLDCLAGGRQLGRGLFMRGNHAAPQPAHGYCLHPGKRPLRVPLDFPGFALNRLTIKLFNLLYFHKQQRKLCQGLSHYLPFFYPLDSLAEWNRIYGKRGFFQYQCVVPAGNPEAARAILRAIAASGQGSFLGVMKLFGDLPSPGLLSFPRRGFTLALDFAYHGRSTLALFERLDALVRDEGGVLYPAKDARMSAADFQHFYPQWQTLENYRDPRFSSSFWRRVTRPPS